MEQRTTRYGTSVRLPVPYEQAIARVTAALKDEEFGIGHLLLGQRRGRVVRITTVPVLLIRKT